MEPGSPNWPPGPRRPGSPGWDLQQQDHLPDREERFTALIDAVEAGARPDPLVLDLGCGPGSLAVRLLDRMPAATVVAIDADPLLLALGRAATPGGPGSGSRTATCARRAGRPELGLDRPADVAVSTTALHWLPEPALRAMYAELARCSGRPGLLLDGDHFAGGEHTGPVIAQLSDALTERAEQRRFPLGHAETWSGWWAAVAADPQLAEPGRPPGTARPRRGPPRLALGLAGHPRGRPAAAGFSEVGTVLARCRQQPDSVCRGLRLTAARWPVTGRAPGRSAPGATPDPGRGGAAAASARRRQPACRTWPCRD